MKMGRQGQKERETYVTIEAERGAVFQISTTPKLQQTKSERDDDYDLDTYSKKIPVVNEHHMIMYLTKKLLRAEQQSFSDGICEIATNVPITSVAAAGSLEFDSDVPMMQTTPTILGMVTAIDNPPSSRTDHFDASDIKVNDDNIGETLAQKCSGMSKPF